MPLTPKQVAFLQQLPDTSYGAELIEILHALVDESCDVRNFDTTGTEATARKRMAELIEKEFLIHTTNDITPQAENCV